MGEKAKNTIIDILKSHEMRTYFEEILKEQTTEIVSSFQGVEETHLNEEIQRLKQKLDEEQKKSSRLELFIEKQKEEMEASIAEERKRMKAELQSAKMKKTVALSKLKEYEDNFACINRAYSSYKNLPETVKLRMGNIFIRDNIYSFIVAVSDWNSIEGIWSFTKRRIIEDEKEGLRELVALFKDSFLLFNLIDGRDRYELINPAVGERFDSDKHSIKGIKTGGQVEEVLLSGIYDSTTKKAVFKAVVQIQE